MSNMDDLMTLAKSFETGHSDARIRQQPSGLRKDVERSLQQYFTHLGDETVSNLYDLVLTEIEAPLLEAVLRHTGSNQSKASILLGLNRGTLRKKLKQHGLL